MKRSYVTGGILVACVAGIGTMVVVTHGAAWPLAGIWTLGSLCVGGVFSVARARSARVTLGAGTVAGCILLGWVGGVFMLAAAVGLLVLVTLGRCEGAPGRATRHAS